MDRDRDVFFKKWFNLRINGKAMRAQCVDIEYEGDLGPLFLMKQDGIFGKKFWLTRREIKGYTVR